MEIDDVFYSEIKNLRKDISKLRDDLISFKLKVYFAAMMIGGSAGGLSAKLFTLLK